MTDFRRLRPIIYRQRSILSLIALLTVAYSAVAAVQPLPMKILIDYALRGMTAPEWLNYGRTTLIVFAAVSSLALFIVFNALDMALSWLWSKGGQRMVHDLSAELFARIQRRSFSYHATHDVGDSLSRLSGDTWSVYQLTSQIFAPIGQILTLLSVDIVAWKLNPKLALLSLSVAPLLAFATVYFGRRLKSGQRSAREAESRILRFVHQTMSAMPLVQAFATEERNSARFQSLAAEASLSIQRRNVWTSAYGMLTGAISAAGMAVVLFVGGRDVLAGTLALGTLVVFLAYLQRMQKALELLLNNYGTLKPLEASIERVVEVLDEDSAEVKDLPNARAVTRESVRGALRFEHVSFGYEKDRPVLSDIDLKVQNGEVIGLVGATGAGKSTLMSLIPRIVDPLSGRITIAGIDIRDVRIADLREQIAVVLQEPFLFPTTIAENISYGKPNATRDEIIRAAVAANADVFIRRFSTGYDTVIGERGATLSGGERQRISIARALLRDAPILLLDEPTASLDPTTETQLLAAIHRVMAGRTTFVIAHRLSTIRQADRILVLQDGRIREQGTHDDLVRTSALYRRLFALQTRSLTEAAG